MNIITYNLKRNIETLRCSKLEEFSLFVDNLRSAIELQLKECLLILAIKIAPINVYLLAKI